MRHVQQGLDDISIPLMPASLMENTERLLLTHPFAIWPSGGHGVISIGHRDDACPDGDVFPTEPIWIACSGPLFVMATNDRQKFAVIEKRSENALSYLRMSLDLEVLVLGQGLGLRENRFRDADFPDIVKFCGESKSFDSRPIETGQFRRKGLGNKCDTVRMVPR